jgi:predicted metal-dependent enzyme (double-stranded beta helix superfamily)
VLDLDRLVEACLAADGATHLGAQEVMQRAFADPAAIMRAVGEPTGPGLIPIHNSPQLTIVNVIWKPGAIIRPHDHRTWAVIGVYTGREDNIFWRRRGEVIEAAGARNLGAGDVTPLGPDLIHSVVNPLDRLTGAIHVYGGDFFRMERSEWDPEALTEAPYDMEKTRALFAPS